MRASGWTRAAGIVASGAFASMLAACGGGAPAPETTPSGAVSPAAGGGAASPTLSALTPAEASAQVRATRTGCSTELAKQGLEPVDFVTFSRLDNANWNAVIRVRRKGQLTRVGCRYNTGSNTSYVYDATAPDGGNPWGPGGPPPAPNTPPNAAGGAGAAATSGTATGTGARGTSSAGQGSGSGSSTASPPPAPGSNINLRLVGDTTARTAISRTRDACLAEAKRRKLAVSDFDSFRRADNDSWEATLVIDKSKSRRSCRFELATGKATIR